MNMIKKLLSFALVLILVAGLLIPVSAASITVGQAQSVTVFNDETPVILQFIPTKSGYYNFYSYNSQVCDPYGYIMDSNHNLLVQGDDTEDSLDFSITCYLTAGKTYYLAATCYSGSAKYTVSIAALSSPTAISFDRTTYTGVLGEYLYPQIQFFPLDSAREDVKLTSSNEQVVRISDEGDFCLGIPGTATVTATTTSGLTASCTVTVQAPPALNLDTPWTLDAALGAQYLSFTAPADGWYGISSQGDEIDPWVEVMDAALEWITEDDEALPNHNFFAPVYLEANELCYFSIRANDDTGTAQVILQKLDTATAITLPAKLTGYADTVCWLDPVYAPQTSIPEVMTWRSSNEDVVCVDDTGVVSFLKPGNAVITVTSETGMTAATNVTVLAAPADSGITAWGNCGPNLQWQLSTAGVLTVTGSGDMYDRYDNVSHWDDHCEQITQVVLPEGITSLGYGAFMYCYNLTQITIPDSVRHIGNSAFSSCTSLAKVTLPKDLESLGMLAFEYCTALKEIRLPDSLKRISYGTFSACASLSTVTLPNNLISIGDDAFESCSIEQIQLPDTLKTMGYGAFAGADLKQISLPQGLTELRDYTFVNCYLEELTIPATVTKLGCGFAAGNELHTLHFLGNAPVFDAYAFDTLEITAYYPAGNRTWTDGVLQNYGGNVTWMPEGNPGVALTGTVIENAKLTLSLGDEVIETITAQEGNYTFSNLQPGSYTLTVIADNYVTRTYTLTVADQPITQDVAIHLIGDIDGNGKVNIGDVAKLSGHIKGSAPLTDEYILACANVNGGKLNMGDTASLYAHIRGTKKLY